MKTSLLLYSALSLLTCSCANDLQIMDQSHTPLGKHSSSELTQHLNKVYNHTTFTETTDSEEADIIFLLSEQAKKLGFEEVPTASEGYKIVQKDKKLYILSPDENGLLNATYGLLEHLGCGFYISGDASIEKKSWKGFAECEIEDAPIAQDRILFTWHNFLSGCTGWNLDDWKSWVLQARKMRYNAIMVHAYGNNPMVSFTYKGEKKETGYFCNSVSGRDWGNQHVNDVRLLPGGDLFPNAIYGADVTMDKAHREENTSKMMKEVFSYAEKQGLKIIFSYDFDTWMGTPQNIVKKLPASTLFHVNKYLVPNPETDEGYAYYKAQIESLLKQYPQIDELSVCHRIPGDGFGSVWMNFPESEFPNSWKKEYHQKLLQHPDITPSIESSSMFAYGKLLETFIKIKNQIKPDLKISSFSWRFHYVPLADAFFPQEVSLLPLDWEIVFNKPKSKEVLKNAAQHRKINPVVWAHHDDHRYMGRCYRPWENFSTLLKDIDSKGFGVIHWTTRPLDLYFTNTIHQVWQSSENESLKSTLNDYALANYNAEDREIMVSYMDKWLNEGPMFGRETGNHFIDLGKGPAGDKENTWEVMKKNSEKRSELLNQYTGANNNAVYQYNKMTEEFYQQFAENQILFNQAFTALKNKDTLTAITTIQKTYPEDVLRKYSASIRCLPTTAGEKGIFFSMGLRWLPVFYNFKQRLGLLPINYRYQPTQHDPLAAMPGKFTYYIDKENAWWRCMWKHEMSQASFIEKDEVSAWSITGKTELPVKTIHDNPVAIGSYTYTLELANTVSTDKVKVYKVDAQTKRNIPITLTKASDKTFTFSTSLYQGDTLMIDPKEEIQIKNIQFKKQ